jgi:transmembrane sensor
MTQRESSAQIDDAAAAWTARLDRAPLAPAESAELEAWLAENSRRKGAFARARALWVYADRASMLSSTEALSDTGLFAHTPPQGLSRRWAFGLGGALAASVVAGFIGLERSGWRPAQRYQTERGEVRRLPLADGTVVALNTETNVAVTYSPERRNIRLIDGEALFDVAKNPKRPFYVDAGDIRVRAVGTSFSVTKRLGMPTEVLVREGVVEITRQGEDSALSPIRLAANQQASATPGAPITPVDLDPSAVSRALVWQQGMIAFQGTSLGDAAVQFGRYSDPQIVVADPAVAGMTITGLFSANNPAGFAQAVALSLNLNARTQDGKIYLSR